MKERTLCKNAEIIDKRLMKEIEDNFKFPGLVADVVYNTVPDRSIKHIDEHQLVASMFDAIELVAKEKKLMHGRMVMGMRYFENKHLTDIAKKEKISKKEVINTIDSVIDVLQEDRFRDLYILITLREHKEMIRVKALA